MSNGVQMLQARIDAAHDALTRITDADTEDFATLETTVDYVVAAYRAIAAAEAEAADRSDELQREVTTKRAAVAEEIAQAIAGHPGPNPSPAIPAWWAGYEEAKHDLARVAREHGKESEELSS